MNENIDLTKILENCPEGTTFWSDDYGEVRFKCISKSYNCHINYPILVKRTDGYNLYYTKEGWHNTNFPSNCLLWPSKDCRDWSKFTAPWYKKEKFDPKTLNPFDRVLVRNYKTTKWRCEHFSYFDGDNYNPCIASCCSYTFCIPYNDDTKHLIGKTDDAPDFYKYWEK